MDPLLHAGTTGGKGCFFGGGFLGKTLDSVNVLMFVPPSTLESTHTGGGELANGSVREKEGGGVGLGIHVKGGK